MVRVRRTAALSAGVPSRRVHPRPARWHLYILQCADSSLYVGTTTDLTRRLAEHAGGRGGAYTRSRLPVVLRYHEPHANRVAAQRREAQLKRLRREEKLSLLNRSADRLR